MPVLFWLAWLGAFAAGGWFVLAVEVAIVLVVWLRIWRDP